MIFPEHCKQVGVDTGRPCGDRVYFLTRYLIREGPRGSEIFEVEQQPGGHGPMRGVASLRPVAKGKDVAWHPDPVNLHDRAHLIMLAAASGRRCTIFRGLDEHTTFVCDPDPASLLAIHLYDVVPPPRPHLSATVKELERDGLFGDLSVSFVHHVRDIRDTGADVYPCRAAGFSHSLDSDRVRKGEKVAGCMTGAQILRECGVEEATIEEICPLESIGEEPFIARCCRGEREGVREFRGRFGGIVHWGAGPWTIADTVRKVAGGWRAHAADRSH
ncbi:MAG TPA: hypothetical protein VMB35_08125 [Methanomicrobiales archaeon]|nr:hypothetical protein [Methanomicrobiales archaeon]